MEFPSEERNLTHATRAMQQAKKLNHDPLLIEFYMWDRAINSIFGILWFLVGNLWARDLAVNPQRKCIVWDYSILSTTDETN